MVLFFGFFPAVIVSLVVSALASMTMLFWMRYLFSTKIQEKFQSLQKQYLNNLESNQRQLFGLLVSMRLFPLLPYFVVTAIFSLSTIRMSVFVLGSLAGRFPLIVLYSLLGEQIKMLTSENFKLPGWQLFTLTLCPIIVFMVVLKKYKIKKCTKYE